MAWRLLPLLALVEMIASLSSRMQHPRMQLDPMPKGGASSLLFQDAKIAMTKRAERERELLEPNSRPMTAPKRAPSNGKSSKGGGGGFGANGATRTALQQATDMRADTLDSEGVCLIPGVLSTDSAARLRECVADELARSYAAVENDSSSSVARFNVPVETHDPKRGYLLLPLRDGRAVDAGEARGTLICALQELLGPNSTLGAMFSTTCGGESAELYDLVALRTEAGAARQPVHSDTPYQKVPGLFCAFIALQDVRYEMGTTMFIPKTHLQTKQRLSFDNGQFDGQRDAMLASAQPRHSMLQAGDAVFFNMNTLHAGTANFPEGQGGSQRLLFILTFRNRKARQALGHEPNLRPGYRNRGITLADMRRELASDEPFAGIHQGDGDPFGDGLQ